MMTSKQLTSVTQHNNNQEKASDTEKYAQAVPKSTEDSQSLPSPLEIINGKAYWKNPLFIGTYLALSFSACGYYAAFSMPSNTLSIINADIGMRGDAAL